MTITRIVFKHVHDLNLFNLPTEQIPSSLAAKNLKKVEIKVHIYHDSKLSYSFFGKHPRDIVELSILAKLEKGEGSARNKNKHFLDIYYSM